MPCFSTGTLITTLKGEIAIEELAIGDRIVTRDHGLQTLRRISRRDFDYAQIGERTHLAPIVVLAGALDQSLPERDMLVSPNLRVLATTNALPMGAMGRDRLVAIKALVDSKSVRGCSVLGVSYVHLEFDAHETVLANGAWFECFHPTDASLGSAGNAQRTELFELFPDLRPAAPKPPVTRGRYRQMADRHYGL